MSSLEDGIGGREPKDYYAKQTAKEILKLPAGLGSLKADRKLAQNTER